MRRCKTRVQPQTDNEYWRLMLLLPSESTEHWELARPPTFAPLPIIQSLEVSPLWVLKLSGYSKRIHSKNQICLACSDRSCAVLKRSLCSV